MLYTLAFIFFLAGIIILPRLSPALQPSPNTKPNANMSVFPPEIWEHIFSFWSYKDLKCTLPAVSHSFADIIRFSSPMLDAKLFKSKTLYEFPSGEYKGPHPLDDNAKKVFAVHPALREKIGMTPNVKTVCVYKSKSKYKREKKPEPLGKWARLRYCNLGEICLEDCDVFEENATEPPVNKMTIVFRGDNGVGGHGKEEYPPAGRAKIELSSDQAIKVKHVVKSIVEYKKHNKFNDDTEETVEVRIKVVDGKLLVGNGTDVIFGEEEENDDEEDFMKKNTEPFDKSDNDFKRPWEDEEDEEDEEMDEDEDEEGEEEGKKKEKEPINLADVDPSKYRRGMDWMAVSFARQVQNIRTNESGTSLTLWGMLIYD